MSEQELVGGAYRESKLRGVCAICRELTDDECLACAAPTCVTHLAKGELIHGLCDACATSLRRVDYELTGVAAYKQLAKDPDAGKLSPLATKVFDRMNRLWRRLFLVPQAWKWSFASIPIWIVLLWAFGEAWPLAAMAALIFGGWGLTATVLIAHAMRQALMGRRRFALRATRKAFIRVAREQRKRLQGARKKLSPAEEGGAT